MKTAEAFLGTSNGLPFVQINFPAGRSRPTPRAAARAVICGAVAIVVLAAQGASAATIAQQAYLKASNTGSEDVFGNAVALSRDTLVVGAPSEASRVGGVNGDQHDNSAFGSGAAYVFVRNGTNWIQQAYLKASNPDINDRFGWSVAIDGDTVVVGADGEGSHAAGVNGDQTDNSVPSAGAAYVFVRNGTNWIQQAYLKASNTDQAADLPDTFGISVSISGDTIVVGAPFESSQATGVNGDATDNSEPASGAAYVFTRRGTNWTQQAYLKASNTEKDDFFGISVAIDRDTVVIGARLESSAATGVNGDQADNNALYAGAAYVFARHGTNWSQQAYLKASNTGESDLFGNAVAVSGDTVLVGAPGEDSAATGVNGDQANNSASDSGAVYVFVRHGVSWNQQAYLKASNSGSGDSFGGGRMAMAGRTLVVGAIGESSNATGVNGDESDNRVGYAGAAYVFLREGTSWNQQAYLKASNTGGPIPGELPGDLFGRSVAVWDNTIVVGAIFEDSAATGINGDQHNDNAHNAGAAYVFTGLGPLDDDGDGVLNADDACPDTLPGAIVDVAGCSLSQLVPCDGPWRSHGQYIRALLKATTRFLQDDLITRKQWRAILLQGVKSDCGRRPGKGSSTRFVVPKTLISE